MLLTRLPLDDDLRLTSVQALRSSEGRLVRLACLRHAASVHPEPGSNSPKNLFFKFDYLIIS